MTASQEGTTSWSLSLLSFFDLSLTQMACGDWSPFWSADNAIWVYSPALHCCVFSSILAKTTAWRQERERGAERSDRHAGMSRGMLSSLAALWHKQETVIQPTLKCVIGGGEGGWGRTNKRLECILLWLHYLISTEWDSASTRCQRFVFTMHGLLYLLTSSTWWGL